MRVIPRSIPDLLRVIRARLDIPLVLHGGSGCSDAQFRATIENGISKINVATDLFALPAFRLPRRARVEASYWAFSRVATEAFRERVSYYVDLFGASGKAHQRSHCNEVFDNREDIIQLTPLWRGSALRTGARRYRMISSGACSASRWKRLGPFCGAMTTTSSRAAGPALRPYDKIVGRAVTGVFVPHRPDLHDYLMQYGHEQEKRIGAMNSWVIETLREDDVIVIDLLANHEGTYSGANLSTAIATRTKRGQVINGGIRVTLSRSLIFPTA